MRQQKITARPDEVETFDCEQGSEDWHLLHLGIASASVFSVVMASGKEGGESVTRRKLLYKLAAEVLTGKPRKTYHNAYMDRGNAMEPGAREHYAFTRGVEVQRTGFVRRTIHRPFEEKPLVVGCSPDGLVGSGTVLEIKTMESDLLIEAAVRGTFPAEHRAQCQGSLWVTGREQCDLVLYDAELHPAMPTPSFILERDEAYIRRIRDAVEVFDYDLRQLVKQIRAMR
jgi:hypothetical protein